MIPVKHRYTGTVLCEGEDIRSAVVTAVNSGADLSGAHLCGAHLGGAYLRGAHLSGADLCGADLCGAHLSGAHLSGAYLRGAYLSGAHLGGAYLSGAHLCGADLSGAHLSGADLSGADLSGAHLSGADLCGVDLSGAHLAWQNHWLLGYVLLLESGQSIARRKIAGLIAMSSDWCWDTFLAIEDDEREWALTVLADYLVDGDNAPQALRDWADARKGVPK